jgi:cytochrome bd ubiquinol oxidase subunit II
MFIVFMMPVATALLSPLASAYALVGLLWLSLIAFAVLAGADFGAGFWDFFAFGREEEKERGALIRAIGPIWEANAIWLIFVVTGLFTAFPGVFAALSIALFIPGSLALLGLVMRGAAFAYYSHFREAPPVNLIWGRIFALFSMIAPFSFGLMAGAVAGGRIQVQGGQVTSDFISPWLTAFSFVCGTFALAMCALLAATYMVVEAQNAGDPTLVAQFRVRALLTALTTMVIGAIAYLVCFIRVRYLWDNLTGRALPVLLVTALLGIATVALLWLGYFRLARLAVAGTVGGILLAWGVGQFPYLVPPDLTIANSAAPPSVIGPLLVSSLVGMLFLLPSLWLLFWIFKGRNPPVPYTSAESHFQFLLSSPEPDLNEEHREAAGEMSPSDASPALLAAASFTALVASLAAMLALGVAITFRRIMRILRRNLVE